MITLQIMKSISQNYNKYLSVLYFLFLLPCCTPKESVVKKDDNNFQRTALLNHSTEKLIMPAYLKFQQQLADLKIGIDSFTTNTSTSNLLKARNQWIATAIAWQKCNTFNFGPSTNFNFGTLLENVGTFPASPQKIEQYISNNDISMGNFDRDSRGLYGLEYLLFEPASLEETVTKFTSSSGSIKRLNYLNATIKDIKKNTDQVVNEWQNYGSKFVADNSTNSTSSITLYYNAFLIGFENLKNFKIGIPAGKRAGQVSVAPEQAEGYYSATSIKLIIQNFATIAQIWKGEGLDGVDGIGFEEYIRSIEGGNTLADATSARILEIKTKLMAIENEDLTLLIKSKDPRITELYDLLSNTTRYFKSDMSSLLGLTITYSSGDGD